MHRPSYCRVDLDTIGFVWTGKFDLNTVHVDGEIVESVKKKLHMCTGPKIINISLNILILSFF